MSIDKEDLIYKCCLPLPPSVNMLYGQRPRGQRYKTKRYLDWLAVCPELPIQGIDYPVSVSYIFYLPDRINRDLSNYIKAPEDYLVSCGVLSDDNFKIVSGLMVEFGGIDKVSPRVEIEINSNSSSISH